MVDPKGVGPLLEHLEKQRNFLTFNRTANERNAMVKHALEQGYIVHDERRHTYQLTNAGRTYLASGVRRHRNIVLRVTANLAFRVEVAHGFRLRPVANPLRKGTWSKQGTPLKLN